MPWKVKYLHAVFLIILLGWCWILSQNPAYNWDMTAYLACLVEIEEDDPEEIHRQTYALLQRALPDEDFRQLSAGNTFKKRCASDPEFFYRNLPFYRVKPLYVWGSYPLFRAGLPATTALAFLPMLSLLGIGALFYYWLSSYLPQLPALLLSITALFWAPVSELGRFFTPDALSCLSLLCAFYLILEKKAFSWAAFLLLIATWARIENAILGILLVFSLWATWPEKPLRLSWRPFLIWFAVYLCSALLLPVLLGNSWDWFSDSGQLRSLESYREHWINLIDAIRRSFLFIPLFIGLLVYPLIDREKDGPWLLVIGVCVLNMVIRLLITPYFEDRFFVSFYLLFLVFTARVSGRQKIFQTSS